MVKFIETEFNLKNTKKKHENTQELRLTDIRQTHYAIRNKS